MEKVLVFQLSLFGSFINIQPNLQITNNLVGYLQGEDFVPATIEVNTVNPATKQIQSESRLQMITNDKTWNINFFSDRIDINYSFLGGDRFYPDINSVVNKACGLCEKVFSAFPDTTGSRVAMNGRFLLRDMTEDEKQAFVKRHCMVPQVYGDQKITEWAIHFNSPTMVQFSEWTELCNNIIEINNVMAIDSVTLQASQRMAVGLDMSTDQTNMDMKYKYMDLLGFAKSVCPLMEKTVIEVEER